jgi:ubiquinone/menaquinone biosynthesis C-methylase UbiE
MLAKFLAKQLSNPSGIFGKLVLAPLWSKRNSALNDVAFESLALHPHDRVLEVGFGGGYLLGRMAAVVTDGFLAGVDVSPAMVGFCEKRYRSLVEAGKLELKCAKAESLPYPSGHFTKACTVNSIFYWENAPQAISELYRALEAGGMLVMCFTCKRCIEDKKFARHGVALYEVDQVCQMMESAGFCEIGMTRASDRHREFLCVIGRK